MASIAGGKIYAAGDNTWRSILIPFSEIGKHIPGNMIPSQDVTVLHRSRTVHTTTLQLSDFGNTVPKVEAICKMSISCLIYPVV